MSVRSRTRRCVVAHLVDPVDDLADAARPGRATSSWRCRLSRSCSRRRRGMMTPAAARCAAAHEAQREALDEDERQRRQRPGRPGTAGWMKASPTNPPIGSTSSLMMVAASDGFMRAHASGRSARSGLKSSKRSRRSMRSPSAPLRMLIDVFERAVDQHEQQEHAAEREQVAGAIQLEAVEQHRSVPGRDDAKQLRGRAPGEGAPLDGVADDLLGNVQRRVIEGQRGQHDQEHANLFRPAAPPDIPEQPLGAARGVAERGLRLRDGRLGRPRADRRNGDAHGGIRLMLRGSWLCLGPDRGASACDAA